MIHDSPLVQHARDELRRLGETDRRFVASIVSAVGEFAAYGHSGGSAPLAAEYLRRLVGWDNLAPLTGDPAEWIDRSEMSGRPLWQSRRNPRAFSTDAGDTWFFQDPRYVGEQCIDAGEDGTAVACPGCGGSGLLFQPDFNPVLHANRGCDGTMPARPFTRRADPDEDEAGGDGAAGAGAAPARER